MGILKVSDETLVKAYRRHQSVWKAAAEVGLCGQSVHERLVALGENKKRNVLSVEDKAKIEALYRSGFTRGDGRLKQLAATLGRTVPFVSRYAKSLGLTSYGRRMGAEELVRHRARHRGQWFRNSHPRGMLGKKHSTEARARISEAGTGRKLSTEQVLKSMKTRVSRYGKAVWGRSKTTWKGGWRTVGGVRFYARSRWEANYARHLEDLRVKGAIAKWEHEPETFWFEAIRRGTRSYLPDFRVTFPDGRVEYHEVKGWMDSKSKTKLKRMKKYHPSVVLVLVQAPWFRKNEKRGVAELPGWEPKGSPAPVDVAV